MRSPSQKSYLIELGSRISEARRKNGLFQRGLASKLGIPVATWRNYEQGLSAPKLSRIPEISRALNVSLDWLLTGSETSEVEKLTPSPESSLFLEFVQDEELLRRFKPTADELIILKNDAAKKLDWGMIDMVARLAELRKNRMP